LKKKKEGRPKITEETNPSLFRGEQKGRSPNKHLRRREVEEKAGKRNERLLNARIEARKKRTHCLAFEQIMKRSHFRSEFRRPREAEKGRGKKASPEGPRGRGARQRRSQRKSGGGVASAKNGGENSSSAEEGTWSRRGGERAFARDAERKGPLLKSRAPRGGESGKGERKEFSTKKTKGAARPGEGERGRKRGLHFTDEEKEERR